MTPELNVSRFAPYQLYVDNIINEENVASVELNLSILNGNSTPTTCWDYKVDGNCDSTIINKSLTYDSGNGRWTTSNIYPDQIYPEIYFAPSSITWYNTPLDNILYRETYSILSFDNSFDMVGDMSFWIEVNAVARNSNSSDLQVYIVSNTANLSDLQTDWRNSSKVELVGTISNTTTFNHTHSVNASHHLISLRTNSNGTIGTKSLDVSERFWIILYSQSPNTNRGWNLRYQPSNLCTYDNRWYTGNQFGWNVTEKEGCPDAHIHIARENLNMDAVNAKIRVTYSNEESITEDTIFNFGTIPNLAPNTTSFISPTVGYICRNNQCILGPRF